MWAWSGPIWNMLSLGKPWLSAVSTGPFLLLSHYILFNLHSLSLWKIGFQFKMGFKGILKQRIRACWYANPNLPKFDDIGSDCQMGLMGRTKIQILEFETLLGWTQMLTQIGLLLLVRLGASLHLTHFSLMNKACYLSSSPWIIY